MKVKDPHFVLDKIRIYIDGDIKKSRCREEIELSVWKYFETSFEEKIDDAYAKDYDDSSWKEFRLNDSWGGFDRVAWFRTDAEVPSSWKGNPVALKLLVGPRDGGDSTAETLLYINGKNVQAIDVWHDEALLDEVIYSEGKALKIALKAWSGVLGVPRVRVFKEAKLIRLDGNVDKFYYVTDTLLHCIKLLNENDLRRIHLTKLINNAFKKINFLNYKSEGYYDSIKAALDYLQNELDKLAELEEMKPTVYGVGHSHIDMAWLWRLRATREKASRTFSTVLNLMRQYPEYRYMHSSPQLYKFLKQDYPYIYEQVKEKIQEGQWEITGGMWVEPDTNVPSGESLVRQFVFGKRFIKDEFNKDTRLVWLPDVFGYSGALPQIMVKSGMKYFMTTKISWNQYNHFPYDTFKWKGIDGSEIFTHFITTPEDDAWFYTYNGHMSPRDVVGVWENYKDKDKNTDLLISFGWGDGGGGPTREMIEQSFIMKNIPGIPKVKIDTAENYFERIYENIDHDTLNTWEGELYFEMHRGTYTSQAETKKYNRNCEVMLHNIEFMSSLADCLSNENNYPTEKLNTMWERVLLNQFHDILPGSSIRQVYEDAKKDYQEITENGQGLINNAKSLIGKTIKVCKNSVVVYNTAGFVRSDIVFVPYAEKITKEISFKYGDELLNHQASEDGIFVFVPEIPSYGYKTIEITKAKSTEDMLTISCSKLENAFFEIHLNENGEIIYWLDKENQKVISTEKPMNVFAAFEDKPQRYDAWDIDVYYKEKPYPRFEKVSSEVIETGSVYGVLRQQFKFNNSILMQDIIIYKNIMRIDFKTTVDWKEKQVLLKAYFPVDIHADHATYEIQFGNLTRPTHTNTEWDFARFEVCGHRWADISENNYGVALLNDCKYGYDIQDNVLGLSLIKSAIEPDETADRRVHEFTYSLYPHAGSVHNSNVQKEAMMLNMPLLCEPVSGTANEQDESIFSMIETSTDHIIVDTIKKSEDCKGYIVRLYEYKNIKNAKAELKFNIPVKKAVETNLCEEDEREISMDGSAIFFPIGCFEIKTFKLYL